MTDPSPNGLNFGHLGAANYDLDNSKWTFDRNGQRQELSVLGQWRATIPAATSHTTPNLLRSSRTIQHAARELARDYAHLTPAVELLSRLETVSAAATIATTAYDATIGSLLSFGSIACKGHSDHRPKPVVATTAGETGNILQLQVVEKERHGWEEHGQGICLEGPSLANGDRAYWNENAAPIRQICFAEGEDRRTFLAARFPCRTVLFHPANVHRTKVSARSKYFDLPPSNIDPCPIHSIPMSATGGIPHADVSFNYEYQRQVGIVDERGQWSIWDIDDGYRTDNYTVTRSVFGDLTPNADGDSESSEQSDQTKEDGWARIFWCGDANTVVIANRRRLCIFNMKGGLTPLKSPRIISGRSADWILDVRRNPASKNHFFVLTSTQLYMVAVTCPSDDPGFDHVEPGSAIVLSWTHFRGMEDITLQLCVHVAPEHGCKVLLHSRLNSLVIVYQFVDQRLGMSSQWTCSDPILLSIGGFDPQDGAHRIHQLHLANFDYKERGYEDSTQGRNYQDEGVQFYHLTAVLSDLSVRQAIIYNLPTGGAGGASTIEPTSWVRTIKRPQCQWKGLVNDLEADIDFVRPDGMLNATEPRLKRPCRPPKSIKRQPFESLRHSFDFDSLYEALHDTGPTLTDDDAEAPVTADVAVAIGEVERLLKSGNPHVEPPLGTLLEFSGTRLTVSNVDEASAKLPELLSCGDSQLAQRLQTIASGHVVGLASSAVTEAPTIASLYDSVLENWIAPLPTNVPVSVRQNKERLARQIAADLILASTRILRPDYTQQQFDTQPGHSQGSEVAISHSASQLPLSDPLFSQPSSLLPNLTQTHTESPSSAVPSVDPLSRLRRHLCIEKPAAKPLPTGISHILSHWQLGTDPSTYSWDASEEALQEEDEDSDDAKQEMKRQSDKRKQERREKRQKRENDLFIAKTFSQPAIPRSSPGPFFSMGVGGAMSSQMPGLSQSQSQSQAVGGMGGLGVQTQVEPGKHGGRPVLKKKKKGKKRVGGF